MIAMRINRFNSSDWIVILEVCLLNDWSLILMSEVALMARGYDWLVLKILPIKKPVKIKSLSEKCCTQVSHFL